MHGLLSLPTSKNRVPTGRGRGMQANFLSRSPRRLLGPCGRSAELGRGPHGHLRATASLGWEKLICANQPLSRWGAVGPLISPATLSQDAAPCDPWLRWRLREHSTAAMPTRGMSACRRASLCEKCGMDRGNSRDVSYGIAATRNRLAPSWLGLPCTHALSHPLMSRRLARLVSGLHGTARPSLAPPATSISRPSLS